MYNKALSLYFSLHLNDFQLFFSEYQQVFSFILIYMA